MIKLYIISQLNYIPVHIYMKKLLAFMLENYSIGQMSKLSLCTYLLEANIFLKAKNNVVMSLVFITII